MPAGREGVTVVQLSDLHLGAPDSTGRARRAVGAVRALDPAPDLVLVTGDLAEHGTAAEYAEASELLAGFDPLVVPGNHDVRDPMAAVFGPVSDRVHRADGVTVVLLDTLVPGRAHGTVAPAGLDLLADAARDPAPLLVALHHPPVPVGQPTLDPIRLADAEPLGALLAARRDPTLVVCGHLHRAVATTFAGHPLVIAPSVAPATRFPDEPGEGLGLERSDPGGVLHVLGDGPPRSRFATWPDRAGPSSDRCSWPLG